MNIHSQSGFNLLSLMVGTLVSSMITLAMFTFFMSISTHSRGQLQQSNYEGNLSFLLNTIELEILNSGYLLSNDNHIEVEQIADLYKIYFRYKDSSTNQIVCRSIEEILVDNNDHSPSEIQIKMFVPTNNCNLTDTLKSMRWDQPLETLLRFENRSVSVFESVEIKEEKCAPYMIGDTNVKHKVLAIKAHSTVDSIKHSLNLCLINL